LALIRRFVDVEQNLIARDFAHVFSLSADQVHTVVKTPTPAKKRKSPSKRMVKRIRRVYGL
jgi:hypothetical protein